ncbi:hypothetical protein AMECASPLE_016791 [Ameca splendens]|uniref:Chromatin assembly factor 1 subunit p150 N-terminal domain-containing protein n=1 Tax=Ameca splendens TaxID=208324 RepID=A0ABV0Z087_9TELE
MDCKSSNKANKKLIQARLPFKRLNVEPKENQPPKRPCTHSSPGSEAPDTQNENESSPLSERSGPPLVNGRGPIDGFLRRRCPASSASSDSKMLIDLTECDKSSSVKCLGSPAPASSCATTKNKHQCKDRTGSSGKHENVTNTPKTQTADYVIITDDEVEEEEEEEEDSHITSISQLDTTQDSDSEPEEQDESGNVSSLGNKSTQSPSSASSMSESSPENTKTDEATPAATPKEPKIPTTPKIPADQKKIKRRSLKSREGGPLPSGDGDRQTTPAEAQTSTGTARTQATLTPTPRSDPSPQQPQYSSGEGAMYKRGVYLRFQDERTPEREEKGKEGTVWTVVREEETRGRRQNQSVLTDAERSTTYAKRHIQDAQMLIHIQGCTVADARRVLGDDSFWDMSVDELKAILALVYVCLVKEGRNTGLSSFWSD